MNRVLSVRSGAGLCLCPWLIVLAPTAGAQEIDEIYPSQLNKVPAVRASRGPLRRDMVYRGHTWQTQVGDVVSARAGESLTILANPSLSGDEPERSTVVVNENTVRDINVFKVARG